MGRISRIDQLIWELAREQYDVVAVWQLVPLGITHRTISRRVADSRLHRLFRGVYAVGSPRVSSRGRWRAATLAYGPRAILSHRDSAALADLPRIWHRGIDVTVPDAKPHPQRGINVHRSDILHPEDLTTIDDIPCTSIARTLLDLATCTTPTQHRRAYEKAERTGALDALAIDRLLDRSRGHHGWRRLSTLRAYDPTAAAGAESELERIFCDLMRKHHVPAPLTNVPLDGFLVDAYWPDANLVVELDGYEFHRDRDTFERDRERIAALRLAGREVVPFTYRQVTREGGWVAATVHELRRRSGPS